MIILLASLLPLVFSNPEVETEFGWVRGISYPLKSGKGSADIFYGIPYAEPPIGDLRYEKPEKPQHWNDVKDCTKMAPACQQHVKGAFGIQDVSEDCLTLNIITPSKRDQNRLLPVLFHIHGGGYEIGSAGMFNHHSIADLYSDKDVIIVFIQYRLSFLGFMSSGRSDLPGNLGLFDQTEALKFVHRNIRAFGGDPSRIIAWGVSAGGASSSQLSLSPYSRDYLAGTIEISGSAWNAWSHRSPTVSASKQLVIALGCPWDQKELKGCLKTKTIEEIHEAMTQLQNPKDSLGNLAFTPRMDGDFLPLTTDELAAEAPKIPKIIGANAKESAFFTILGLASEISKSHIPFEKQANFGEADLREFIKKVIARNFDDQADEVEEEILAFYTRDKPASADRFYYLDKHTDVTSDLIFNVGIRRGAESRYLLNEASYVFLFEHFAPDLYESGHPVNGSYHLNDCAYMVDWQTMGSFEWTEQEQRIRRGVLQMVATFAHNLKPSTDDVTDWPKYTDKGSEYVAITTKEFEKRKGFFEESGRFWDRITAKYGFDAITEMRRLHRSAHTEL